MNNKAIIMLGTSFNQKGGVSSVVNTYKKAGLFRRCGIIYIPTNSNEGRFGKLFVASLAFVRLFHLAASRRISLVHIHTASRASFWRKSIFVLFSLATFHPVILHIHGGGFIQFYEEECGPIAKRFVRLILNKVTRIIALSNTWKTLLSQITSNQNIISIPNPLDRKSREAFPSSNTRQRNVLLFLGHLSRGKGIFDLLEAVNKLRCDFPDIKLLCAGDGDLNAVSRRTRELSIDNSVEILGWVEGDHKNRLLAEASVYILPSYNEGLPMSLLEAMAAGVPVIATRVGGIPDVVQDGVEGLLVQPGDVDALTDTIRMLLTNSGLRDKIGAYAQKKVNAEFTPQKILAQVEALYCDLGAIPKSPHHICSS